MNTKRLAGSRNGAGMVELLVAIVIMGIVGGAAMRAFVTQSRFADVQFKQRSARTVSRSPINLAMAEVRMVENTNGVAAASATSGSSSVTLRVPIMMGLVCGASGGGTVLSVMPTDSVALAGIALSGYAYQGSSGAYTYQETSITQASGLAAICTGVSITTVTGGRVILVTPAIPAAATAGTPAFLYQRVKYSFGPSTTMSGRRALWRTLEATNVAEEIAAPFDTSSRFRFYRNNNDTSDVVVPPLAQINGLELFLVGASENARAGRTLPETATIRTGIFFSNRIN